jgi:hypothetical protein
MAAAIASAEDARAVLGRFRRSVLIRRANPRTAIVRAAAGGSDPLQSH